MGREIPGTTKGGAFPPMVGIGREIGQFVRGKVVETGMTKKNNPALTLELIDLNGSTSISAGKGQGYEEVEVSEGDHVQLVANLTDLREKLPQIKIGDVITVTYSEDVPSGKGHPKKIFKVLVD